MDRRVCGWRGLGAGPGSGWRAGAHGEVQARLKVNGKFECLELQEAEVKKGSRVDNFPADPAERFTHKYYIGANSNIQASQPAYQKCLPLNQVLAERHTQADSLEILRAIFLAWPATESVTIARHGAELQACPITSSKLQLLVCLLGPEYETLSESLCQDILARTEGTPGQICWLDVQQAFMNAGVGSGHVPPGHMCHPQVAPERRIGQGRLVELLEGQWRMYLKTDRLAVAYGFVITDVHPAEEMEHMVVLHFSGRSQPEGKFVLDRGQATSVCTTGVDSWQVDWNRQQLGEARVSFTERGCMMPIKRG